MEKVWLRQYPAGVPAALDTDLQASSLVSLLDAAFTRHRAAGHALRRVAGVHG